MIRKVIEMIDAEKHKNNPVLQFVLSMLELSSEWGCVGRSSWVVAVRQMRREYLKYCNDNKILALSITSFNNCLAAITPCERRHVGISVMNKSTNKSMRSTVRCWCGCRLNGTSGSLQNKTEE